MKIISKEDLYQQLQKEETITNKEIQLNYIDLKHILVAKFENCKFTSNQIHFINSNIPEEKTIKTNNFSFYDCEFNHVLISGIKNIGFFGFYNSKKIKSLQIFSCNFDSFIFQNNVDVDCKIEISFCEFFESFYFSLNEFTINGEFHLLQNTFHKYASIINNGFNILNSRKQYFKDFLIFKNEFAENSVSSFNECEFSKTKFNESEFSNLLFEKCDFLSTTWFEECKNLFSTNLKFVACEFKGYVLFDNSKFNSFTITHSFFERKVSFDSFETNSMTLHQVSFEKLAYFDDLNKSTEKVISNWDRKTLRAIKRELINTHNQIDYLRFKAYELNAYKKEVNKNNLNWKDSLILYFNEQSNNFGLNWLRSINFTLVTSFVCYVFYLITFAIVIKDSTQMPQSLEDFLVIYLKFLNPFSFLKSPIEVAENYFFPFFFFLIGKIFVSYGIYQTIQAFRKFGVNGG